MVPPRQKASDLTRLQSPERAEAPISRDPDKQGMKLRRAKTPANESDDKRAAEDLWKAIGDGRMVGNRKSNLPRASVAMKVSS